MRQFSYPNSQFTNILGGASIGWKLNVYDTGTTDYASIYSNLAQTTPTANPVIADADGFLASFYWTGTVDVVLTDENDNLIDSANGIQDLVSTINAVVVAGNITLPFGYASGDGNTITTTLPITADFSDGGVFIVRANANNAGTINTPNLQINSYASRRIKKIGGSALVANDIVSGMNCLLVYHEAQDSYYLLNPNASYLNRDGTAKMLGVIDMDSHKITNLANGTDSGDAVNKSQLDAKALITGSAAQEFAVAAATGVDNAVNKAQFDAKTGISTDTIAGIVEKATQLELNAGTANVWPDAATLLNGFAISGTTNGYIKLPVWLGGFVVQWGFNSSLTNPITITYPIAFDTCFAVFAQANNALSGEIEYAGVSDITSTTFLWNGIRDGVTAYTTGWWMAIGIKS